MSSTLNNSPAPWWRNFSLALRLLLRNSSHPSLRLVVLTLAVGLASVQIIQLTTDRYLGALQRQAQILLGGDLEFSSPQELALDPQLLAGLDFQQAERISFPSMLFAADDLRLSRVRAISDNYPLRGSYLLRLADGSEQRRGAPEPGTIWVDEQLLRSLKLDFGQLVELGGVELAVKAVVLEGPGVFGGFAAFAPSALVNVADIRSADLLADGSRVRYRLVFSAEDGGTIDAIEQRLEQIIGDNQRLQRADSNDDNLGDTIKRARAFFYLSGCLSLLLAIISALLAVSHYQAREQKFVAVVKALGLGPKRLQRLYWLQIALLALAAAVLGSLLAEIGHQLLVNYIRRFYSLELPPAHFTSYLWGLAALVLSLALVVAPKLGELLRTPAWLVLRSRASSELNVNKWQVIAALLCSFLIAWLYSRSWWLSLSFSIALLFLGALSTAAYWLCLRYLRPYLPKRAEFSVAAASLRANWQLNALQCAALSVCAFLFFTLLLVRFGLISDWQRQVPADAPNYFLINITPGQQEPLRQFWSERSVDLGDIYAIVRGRLTEVNEVDSQQRADSLGLEHDSLRRELNFSWSKSLPPGNELIDGQWWPESWQPEAGTLPPVSVERDTFEQLQLQLGDVLEINVAGTSLRAVITSVREVDWGNMRPNFYFLFPPAVLDSLPRSYISSAYIPSQQLEALPEFYQQFPALSMISIEEVIQRVRAVVAQVAQAVEGILSLLLVSMLLLLGAALAIMQQRRAHDLAVLRVLGMNSQVFGAALRWEFLFMAVVAALLALLLSEGVVAAMVVIAFQQSPTWHWWLWAGGLPGVMLLGLVLAWFAGRRVRSTPIQLLASQ